MNTANYHDSSLVQNLISKHEISVDYANRLQYLYGFKTVFIFDDSGSMNSELDDSPLNKTSSQRATRWNELEYFASISLEIANLFDPNGCDVYFLNHQPPIKNIKSVPDFLNYFRQFRPGGYTPLTKTLNQVLNDNAQIVSYEKKLLVIIVTDGEPTDQSGKIDIDGFHKCLLSRKPKDRIFTNIIACTDEQESIDYLNKWDKSIPNLDVVDDFRSEKKQILKAKGSKFRFSYGDYVVKCLLGSVDKTLDKCDETSKEKCTLS
ncbi:von willebrand factor [Brachionus plicatilis]|uniref:von willebrand factor n=1 Tax=Brachionus plicatilis TaxID=10195 RepID=A0A3M7PEX5_BRAPC|nr:von willebrand factor [Brachionus plicatilis]